MEVLNDKFHYVYSSSISNRIQIKIGTLEGQRQKLEYDKLLANPILKYSGLCEDECSDLMVKCQIFDQNQPLTLPVTTSYKPFSNRWSWNEWLTLPIQFNDLPRTAQLALTIYDCIGPNKMWPLGGTTISLFSKRGLFRQGMMDLRVSSNREADGRYPSETIGKTKDFGKEQTQRLTKLTKKHLNGYMTKVDWLDRLLFRELELVISEEKSRSEHLYLMIEFPTIIVGDISHYIVYFEQNGEDIHSFRAQSDIVTVPDQEILKDNLVEHKHHKLARSIRSGPCDKEAKPNAAIRDILNTIVAYPSTETLSNEEQDHVWKFRFYLSSQKKALAKFLKCVNWTQPTEVKQAISMMRIWAPMDVEDALELLSPNFSHSSVRRYAISRLQKAPDEEILLYLLQLVQALKYENYNDIVDGYARISPGREAVPLNGEKEAHLEKKDSKESNSTITNESMMRRSSSYYQTDQLTSFNVNSVIEINSDLKENLPDNLLYNNTDSNNTETLQSHINEEEDVHDLATFLIQRASKNSKLSNYFYWYLLIECEDPDSTIKQDVLIRQLYLTVMKTFSQTLAKGTAEMQNRRVNLALQHKLIDNLVKVVKLVLKEGGNRKKKTEKFQSLLSDSNKSKFNFESFEPMPFPLDPDIIIKGIIAEKTSIFKSAMTPYKLHFITEDNSEYVAIFKHGDDLRQDQLILQMITLMDKLLRKENLDLRLTPYKVLATSTKHGFVQFVPGIGVADVISGGGTIHSFFKKHHPQENGPFGIAPEVIENYIRSCAGYCVITYLLGVGDRHLDNLLLTTSGKLFHIDFGYILGRDPKPMPPAMKICKEMVDAMGGVSSEYYQKFRKQCYTAFLHLRRHANLMLNLFSLMVDASVPDIALEPDKAVQKVKDRFRLDLGDEEAVQYVQNLIESSLFAVVPTIVEHLHKFTMFIKK